MKAWVIDGQSVYCQGGLPHLCQISNDGSTPDASDVAIDRQSALALGADLSAGEFIGYRALSGVLDVAFACKLSQAIQLIHHQHTHKYCTRCGTPFLLTDEPNVVLLNHTAPMRCPNCHHHSYPVISPCVISAIIRTHPTTHKTQILLARHHRHTNIHTLIAGFVEAGETLEMAVRREVAEEVGLQIDTPRYLGSQAWPYPSNLMVGFVANYHSGDITPQADELIDARFFDTDDLPAIAPKGTIARKIIDVVCFDKSD